MKSFLILLSIFFICSCKKDHPAAATPDILMAHLWYPYQMHIVQVDSSSVYTTDTSGNVQAKNMVLQFDTTYLFGQCQQNSICRFAKNGMLVITTACTMLPAPDTSSWSITQTNTMLFPQFAIGSPMSFGVLTQIDNAEFVFYTVGNQQVYGSSTAADGSHIATSDIITNNNYITYKSK